MDEFDKDAFEQTRSILGVRFAETLDYYFQDSEEYCKKIIDGWAGRQLEEIADNAHPLKSSSQAFGFITLGSLAAQIEHSVRLTLEEGQPLDENAMNLAIERLRPEIDKARQQGAAQL